MAFELPIMLMSRNANATLAAAAATGSVQFTFCAEDSSGNIGPVSTAGSVPFGVIQSQPPAVTGAAVDIMTVGVSKVVCGAAVTYGPVMSDANGHVVPVASGGTAIGTLSTALTAGTNTSVLEVAAGTTAAVAAGDTVTLTSGSSKQTFNVTTAAAIGATSLAVDETEANFAYPTTSTITDATTNAANVAIGTCVGPTANPLEIASILLGGL